MAWLNGLNGCINSTQKVQRSLNILLFTWKRQWLKNMTFGKCYLKSWRLLFSLYHHHIRQISVCLIWCDIVCTVRLFQSVSNKYHWIYYAAIKQNNEKALIWLKFLPTDVTFLYFAAYQNYKSQIVRTISIV